MLPTASESHTVQCMFGIRDKVSPYPGSINEEPIVVINKLFDNSVIIEAHIKTYGIY